MYTVLFLKLQTLLKKFVQKKYTSNPMELNQMTALRVKKLSIQLIY